MQVEIISTGDEVITGFITDTNVTFLCQELLSLGIQARFRHTCGDDINDIMQLISERSREADVLLVNGGLGPTTDDNTNEAAARAAGVKQVLHEDWLNKIKAWHEARHRQMPESNIKQALLPEGATMIDNPHGTACGFYLRINKALCFFTPGVPSEFKPMVSNFILPYLKEHLFSHTQTKVKRFFTFGVSESKIGQTLSALPFGPGIVIGYRAAYPLLELKVIEHDAGEEAESSALQQIRSHISNYAICEDTFDLPWRIDRLCHKASFVLFDNVTSGLLATELSAAVNVQSAYITVQEPGNPLRQEILNSGCRYCLSVRRSTEQEGEVIFSLFDLEHKQYWSYGYSLNITLQERRKAAVSLVAQTLLYQHLAGLPLLRPDNTQVRVLADGANYAA